jgi:3',5'-cyclic AMP phosphodiesterase CpdA
MHVSDLHAGWPFRREVGEALLRAAEALSPAAVVVSGDVVQRAELCSHWRQAKSFLARFRALLLVVPGNHDLPVFDPAGRLLAPFSRYHGYVHPETDRVLSLPGVWIAGITTPKRWTVDLGYVSRAQRAWLAGAVAECPVGCLKAVVLHHGLCPQPVGRTRNHVRDSAHLIRHLTSIGVHLVLSGHNHFPHVAVLSGEQRLVWSQAGTATSDHFRHPDWLANSFSVVRTHGNRLEIEWWVYDPARGDFVPCQTHGFENDGGSFRGVNHRDVELGPLAR